MLRWMLWAGIGLGALLVAALLAAPLLLDVPAVQARLERRLSEAARGQLTWEALEVRALPVPHGVLRNARFDFADVATGAVERLEVRLRLLALLTGRIELQHIRILRPVLRVTVPASRDQPQAAAADPVAAYRKAMQPVADGIRRFAPDLSFTVEDAQLDVFLPNLPPIQEVRLMAEGHSDPRGMSITASASGKLWEQITGRARLEYASLAAHAELDGAGLKPQTLLDHFLSGAVVGVTLPEATARVELDTDGREHLQAKLTTNLPAFTTTRDGASVDLKAVHADATVAARGNAVEIDLGAVRLSELVPLASGRLRYHLQGQDEATVALDIPALDLARLRAVATTLAGDQPAVKEWISRIHAGKVSDLRITSRAPQVLGLADPAAVEASLEISEGAMLVPYLERDVEGIAGTARWNGEALTVEQIGARTAGARIANGSFSWRVREQQFRIATDYDVDVAEGLALARRLAPEAARTRLEVLRAARGRAQGRVAVALDRGDWKVDVAVARADAAATLRGVPWPVTLREGRLAVAPGRLSIAGAHGAVGASTFRAVGADLVTAGPLRVHAAHGSAALALSELYDWARQQEDLAEPLQRIAGLGGTLDVVVNRLAGRLEQLDALEYDVDFTPREVHARLPELPDALLLDGGTINLTPRSLRAEAVLAALLDARARVSATVRDYQSKSPQVEASAADGAAGGRFIAWAWRRAQAPARLLPRPLARFAIQQGRWSHANGLDLQLAAQFAAGPAVEAAASFTRRVLEVRNLHISDGESDVQLALKLRGRLIDTRFSGLLTGRTLANMFESMPGEHPGRLEGTFAATIDRDLRSRQFTARGRLTGQVLRLDQLSGWPVTIQRIDLDGDGARLRVKEASIEYAEQKATISGEIRREASGPVVDARIDTPGIVVDWMLPRPRKAAAEATPTDRQWEVLDIWPLSVEGKVDLRAGFLEYQGFRVEPVTATVSVEPQRVRVKVTEAMLCGVAFPFIVEITPDGATGAAQIAAEDQELERTARCLTDEDLLLTGRFDLRADLYARGKVDQLLTSLEGNAEIHARDGKVMKFGLLGNILSLKSVTNLVRGNVRLGGEGFDYRSMHLRGKFEGGRFVVQESAFDSAALGLAATGSIGLQDGDAKLTVLVAPFTRVDQIVRRIPVVGYIFGGTLTSVAVGVNGDIRNPNVVPLDPRAVTSELVGIFERTLKLPGKLVESLQPRGAAEAAQ